MSSFQLFLLEICDNENNEGRDYPFSYPGWVIRTEHGIEQL